MMSAMTGRHGVTERRHLHHHEDAVAPEIQYVYVKEPARGPSRLAELGLWLVLTAVKLALAMLLVVGLFVGGLWLLGKAVEHLPDTSPTTTTGP